MDFAILGLNCIISTFFRSISKAHLVPIGVLNICVKIYNKISVQTLKRTIDRGRQNSPVTIKTQALPQLIHSLHTSRASEPSELVQNWLLPYAPGAYTSRHTPLRTISEMGPGGSTTFICWKEQKTSVLVTTDGAGLPLVLLGGVGKVHGAAVAGVLWYGHCKSRVLFCQVEKSQ